MVDSTHFDPPPATLTMVPDVFSPDTVTPGVAFTFLDPLLLDKGAALTMGPGTLVENLQISGDGLTATADVTVGPRALPSGHNAVVDSPSGILQGEYHVQCPESNECVLDNNFPPFGDLVVVVAEASPFPVTLFFDDPDGDIVMAEIAIEELEGGTVLFTSKMASFATEPGAPSISFTVPLLPPGEYAALGILDDGLSIPVIVTSEFSITAPIPTVSEWGLVILLLGVLTAWTLIVLRRDRLIKRTI